MKRLLSVLLVAAMTAAMLACSPAAPAGTTTASTTDDGVSSGVFRAGIGISNITPDGSVPMQGYGQEDKHMSNGFASYIYVYCLAVQDSDGNTAMVVSADICAIGTSQCTTLRNNINLATGIPVDNILITSIHQHSTPSPTAGVYTAFFSDCVVEAACDAMDDLAPCELYTNTVQTEGLNFVRNYLMSDGTHSHHGTYFSPIATVQPVAHESEADRSLQLLKFAREGQKTAKGKDAKDIIVANFATHPHSGSSSDSFTIHADAPGIFREEVSTVLDSHVMYINGAGGNINQVSYMPDENVYSDYKQRGLALARYAIDAEGGYTKVNAGKVQASVVSFTAENDHSMDHLFEEATAIYNHWLEYNMPEAAMKMATSGQIHEFRHAEAIVAKAKAGPTRELKIPVISFGDIGVTGGPYEMFDTNGMQIKESAPMAMTIMCNMANGSIGYVPSQLGYDNGGYSTDITRLAPGSGEKLAQVMIDTLTQHHNNQ